MAAGRNHWEWIDVLATHDLEYFGHWSRRAHGPEAFQCTHGVRHANVRPLAASDGPHFVRRDEPHDFAAVAGDDETATARLQQPIDERIQSRALHRPCRSRAPSQRRRGPREDWP